MKRRRIFVAYELSKDLKQKILEWREKYSDLSIRWTPLENLHVTLVPPWYREDIEKVVSILESTNYPVSQIEITFDTITLGPEGKRPWLMWARGKMPESLLTLREYLTKTLHREMESRHPVLHTTLARFDKKQYEQLPDKALREAINWKETISSFSLIESHLRRTGVRYETLAKINL